MRPPSPLGIAVVVAGIMLLFFSANKSDTQVESTLSGTIEIDGSSTVFPITEAVAEEFRKKHPKPEINIGVSGTGGGFKRFTTGETDISNASRPIKTVEKEAAQKNNITYIELKVGLDGLALVTNKKNTFATCLTTQELKKIWEPGSSVAKWSDIRPEWPTNPIKLYGPGTDSGTFDYFTEAINGKEDVSRSDYTASEDDNILVQGVSGDQYSLGYFGYAYYAENSDKLNILAVDSGKGCVSPSSNSIENGAYTPLSRPIYIYVKKDALKREEVKEFVRFYLENASKLVKEVGYIPFSTTVYTEQRRVLDAAL